VVLVDTSSWIHMLRERGNPVVRARVEPALREGEACWCPQVRLELWNGAGGDREKKILRGFEMTLPELPVDDEVWESSMDLARRARTQGGTLSSSDLLIAARARRHGAELETSDRDFENLGAI
jgi:predicted nucleic acid-binding protein